MKDQEACGRILEGRRRNLGFEIFLSVGSMEFITRFKVFKKFVFRGFGMEWKRDLSDFF